MKTIHKFELNTRHATLVDIPANAEILSVQQQFERPCMWVKLDTENTSLNRRFLIYGTGHEIKEDELKYIDTFQVQGGQFIFHVFEDLKYNFAG